MRTLEEVIAAHPFPLPAPLVGTMVLEQLQMEDIVKAASWRRALLDLPIGYGKTVIATSISLMLEPDITIVLMPPILIPQWTAWINSIPGVGRALAYEGSPAHRKAFQLHDFKWLMMSYQVFNNDIERLTRDLAKVEVLTITDEAQAVKGRGVLFNHVRSFAAGRDLLLMSGTLLSKPGDAYAYIKLMTPDIYKSYHQFENSHVAKRDIFKQPTEWCNLDVMNTNLSMRRVHRTAQEVHAALPRVNYIPIFYDLSKDHMALYRRLMDEQILKLDDGSKIDATTATRLYHAAQQIIVSYGYFAGDETKRSVIFDLVDEVMGEIGLGQPVLPGAPARSKLILWTIHKKASASISAHVANRLAEQATGARAVAAYSEVDSKRSIREFMGDPLTVGLTAQPGSAGSGLNPQYLCNECGFIEFPTTTIPFKQAVGRIDRKGQRLNPNVRMYVARGTIQEALLKSLFDNDSLVNKVLGSKQNLKNLILP